MDILAVIAERKICEAMERGEFDDLPGSGKPLEMEDDAAGVPEELRMAYRVLKNAGFVPPEVELRREIATLRDLVNTMEESEERRKKRRELDYKLMKLAVMRKRPANLDAFPVYRERIIRKIVG